MKTSVLIILSSLLIMAILAPSIITFTTIDENAITIDFNEEEKKEEKKEAKEKDFFLDSNLNALTSFEIEKPATTGFYLESNYTALVAIILPPPEPIL